MRPPSLQSPEPGLLFHSSVRHERSTELRPGEGSEYQACFEAERIDPDSPRLRLERLDDARRVHIGHAALQI